MKTALIIPALAVMLAWPVSSEASERPGTQIRASAASAERLNAAPQRSAVQRRAVQRRDVVRQRTDDGTAVRRRAAQIEHRRTLHERPDDPTKREIFHQFKRNLYARAHNAVENGARPQQVRQAVQEAIRKFLARLKASD